MERPRYVIRIPQSIHSHDTFALFPPRRPRGKIPDRGENAEDGAVLIWGTPATGTQFGLRKGEAEAEASMFTPLAAAGRRAGDKLCEQW